jgi:MFS family permease
MSPVNPARMSPQPGVGVSGGMDAWYAWITLSEVSSRVSELIRNIVISAFEFFTPILTILGIAQIFFGLLLALGLRQEWLGWRLVVSGLLMIVFVYFIAPLLLQFI